MKNEIKSPTISTLVAELRVVRIGNKQMTKAVFNQLYASNPYDNNYDIIFPIWGKVKGDWNPYEGKFIEYIIFQKGEDLNKFKIPNPKDNPKSIKEFLYYDWLNRDWFYKSYKTLYSRTVLQITEERELHLGKIITDPDHYSRDETSLLRDFVYDFAKTHFPNDDWKIFENDFTKYHSAIIAYNKMVKTLQNAPQLFIAV